MSRRSLLGGILAAAALLGCSGAPAAEARRESSDPRAGRAQQVWLARLDSLHLLLAHLDAAVGSLDGVGERVEAARGAFRAARHAYKHIELAVAYYEPTTADLMNGPALPRVEEEEGPEVVFPPEGFQVVEELLYSDSIDVSRAVAEVRNLIELATRLRTAAQRQLVTDDRVWEAARLQLARVSSLGIADFDSPIARDGLAESAAALRGMRDALAVYGPQLDSAFAATVAVLDTARDADAFDRFAFLRRHAIPLGRAIEQRRRTLTISAPVERRAFVGATLFERDAFDPLGFARPGAASANAAQVALGHRLFREPRLSGDGTRSCATCHEPSRAFTDGQVKSAAIDSGHTLRNAPSMLNVGLQVGSFYDLRTTYLEDQVTDVVSSRSEMHGSVDGVVARLTRDRGYSAMFSDAFGQGDAPVSGERLRAALAAYLRSLTALDSRFDRALRGDTTVISPQERRGFNLFMGRARCGSCHFAPLFHGTIPPAYQESEVEVLGVPIEARTRGARLDPDSGRFRVTRAAPHLHAFRTPSVRNVEVTAPYMHNGAYRSLESVVDFYDRGGGAGIGIALPNQTLPADRLRLTPPEKRALVAFMRSLTDTIGASRR